jgi:hypothetical protein
MSGVRSASRSGGLQMMMPELERILEFEEVAP